MEIMPAFKIHRMKDPAQQHFRWAAHTTGETLVKPKDYALSGEIEAESPYAAWTLLRESGNPLRVGDLLEIESGGLRICKYVGFEEARWAIPEIRPSGSERPATSNEESVGSETGPRMPQGSDNEF
jgi:hypothetical protein